ncbi:MAG: DUF4388 domain-containing protein [Candidatus Methylomirabilales bacterium]
MALEGTLQDFALVDILQLVGMQRKTGTLTLTRKEEAITVLIQDGMVIWASPGDTTFDETLGRILVRRGQITPQKWEEVRQSQVRTGQRLISLLSSGQWVSPNDLERVVQRQVLETLYRTLRWREGKYTFVAQTQVDTSRGQIPPVGTETILLEAVRQIDEWPLVEQRLPSPDLVVQRKGRLVDREKVPPELLDVLELVDGTRTAREIAELCDFGEFDTYKSITDLVAEGVLELERRAETAEGVRATPRVRIRVPRKLPAWLSAATLGAVTAAALLFQFSLGYDPFYLRASQRFSEGSAVQTWRLNVARLELPQALDLYLLLHGGYPNDLTRLQSEGLFSGELRDPWGRPWVYRQQESTYQLISPGPDGRVGTPDDIYISPS